MKRIIFVIELVIILILLLEVFVIVFDINVGKIRKIFKNFFKVVEI